MVDENTRIGKLLAKWRKDAGLSQVDIANALSTQQATISKLESGLYKLSVSQLVSFLAVCGLTVSDVAKEIDDTTGTKNKPLWERINE